MAKVSQARAISNRLQGIRRKYERRAKAFEQAAKLAFSEQEHEYMLAAQSLREEAKQFTMANLRQFHEFRKTDEKSYMGDLSASAGMFAAKATQRLEYVPSQKPIDIVKSNALANVQYKYAGREITVFTYGDVWKKGDTKEERQRKIREEAARGLSEKYGMNVSADTITSAQIMRYYEEVIQEYTGDEEFRLSTTPFEEAYLPAKYAKNLEQGYSNYMSGERYPGVTKNTGRKRR